MRTYRTHCDENSPRQSNINVVLRVPACVQSLRVDCAYAAGSKLHFPVRRTMPIEAQMKTHKGNHDLAWRIYASLGMDTVPLVAMIADCLWQSPGDPL